MKVILYALLASVASAFAPPSSVRPSTQLRESFGFDFAEDSYANQVAELGGEQEYKQFVNRLKEDNMLNRKVRARLRVCFLVLQVVFSHCCACVVYSFFR